MADDKRKAAAARSRSKNAGKNAGTDTMDTGEFGEVVELLKTYVRQETIGPLKGIGGKIAKGVAGALLLGVGLFFLSLGLLRLIQDKLPRLASGSLSWISYLIVVVFCGVVSFVAIKRITKIEKELN